MGILSDFIEVIKELRHKKREENTINFCPKCNSKKISISNSFDIYPRMYGITPIKYVCLKCGYNGSIVLERTEEKRN